MSYLENILIVDDNPRMCDSLKILLSSQGYQVQTSNSGNETIKLLNKNTFELVLLDIVMPDMSGHQIMDYINYKSPETITIVITGHASIESAIESLRKGACDYLRKPFEYDELLKTVVNALEQKRLKEENKIIKRQLKLSEERYRFLVQSSPDIIYTLDHEGKFTFISGAVERLIGYNSARLIGKHYSSIIYDKDLDKAKYLFNERRTGERTAAGVELRLTSYQNNSKSSEARPLTAEVKATGLYDRPAYEKDKQYLGTYGVARDISERKRLASYLHQAKKMEAIGTLAGGIAHDFNNLLMGIQGNTSLMLFDIDSSDPHHQRLKKIEEYVSSGAELTKQLLGFARRGKYDVKPTDLNELVKNTSMMFGHTRKEITIRSKYQEGIWTVEVDQGQIEQVPLDLYVNAWQAMPGGGYIDLETENITIGEKHIHAYHLEPGKYVKISITDTGVGMDEATKERIFEPFFTTKAMGRSVGLGLASAHGIIKNHGGTIAVCSQKGEGTTFIIYLPASEKQVIEEKNFPEEILKGTETVLLVDDEEMIIDVGEKLLKVMGYEVLTARNGIEALEVYRKNQATIDMVILDMIMPEMGGGETYDRLKEINPNVRVLLSSGYSINGEATKIMERGCNAFIQKPFNMEDLSKKLREVLNKQ